MSLESRSNAEIVLQASIDPPPASAPPLAHKPEPGRGLHFGISLANFGTHHRCKLTCYLFIFWPTFQLTVHERRALARAVKDQVHLDTQHFYDQLQAYKAARHQRATTWLTEANAQLELLAEQRHSDLQKLLADVAADASFTQGNHSLLTPLLEEQELLPEQQQLAGRAATVAVGVAGGNGIVTREMQGRGDAPCIVVVEEPQQQQQEDTDGVLLHHACTSSSSSIDPCLAACADTLLMSSRRSNSCSNGSRRVRFCEEIVSNSSHMGKGALGDSSFRTCSYSNGSAAAGSLFPDSSSGAVAGGGGESCVVEIRLPSTVDELRQPLLPEG